MIHLVTGTPGAGKTLRVVELMALAEEAGRRICVHGIPDLTIPHIKLSCAVPGCSFCGGQGDGYTVEDWPAWVEKNDLIVLDEVQQQFRARPQGSHVPHAISALETHRHRGVDFIVITQSPSLTDQNLRKLVTVHDHLKPLPMGQRRMYTWSECNANPQNNLAGADSKLWRLNKKYFGFYRSAELHTKQRTRIPVAVYGMLAALAVAGWFGYSTMSTIDESLSDSGGAVAVESYSTGSVGIESAVSAPRFSDAAPRLPDALDLTPTDPLRLETAPAYVDLVRVAQVPRLAGCIANGLRCKCYTQQATEYPTTPYRCRSIIRGEEFMPYGTSTVSAALQQ